MADLQMFQSQEDGLVPSEKYDALALDLKQTIDQMSQVKAQAAELVRFVFE